MCGFSLGLIGAADVFLNVKRVLSASREVEEVLEGFATLCLFLSVATLGAYFLRFVFHTKSTVQEAVTSSTALAGQVWPASVLLITAKARQLLTADGGLVVAQAFLYAGCIAQVAVTASFLLLAAKERSAPDAAWFPQTVLIGVCALAGGPVGLHDGLIATSAWISLAFFVVLTPVVFVRIYKSTKVDPSASIVILISPASLAMASWLISREQLTNEGYLGPPDFVRVVTHVIFASIVLILFGFVWPLYLRIPRLRRDFFSPQFAATTFPVSTTMNSLLLYGAKCGLEVDRGSGVAIFSSGVILCVFALLGAAYIIVLNVCFLLPYLIGVVIFERPPKRKSYDCGGKNFSSDGGGDNSGGGNSREGTHNDNRRTKISMDSKSIVDATYPEEYQVGDQQDKLHNTTQHNGTIESLGGDSKSCIVLAPVTVASASRALTD
eukprot:jgi/Bigna1/126837/aug1.3_g1545